ncbi:MAG: gamma-glutamyltransferase [Bryobacteraceae bacterium]|nr:gamma-glutamyltransferase [Bryobacteraceae bacterium]
MKRLVLVLSALFCWLAPAQEVSQSGLRLDRARPMVSQPLRAPNGMIASVHELATQAGIGILQKGGNAVDAAVAVGFVLAVVHPEAGNLGGSGFMLLRMRDGKVHAIDYAGTAPSAARPGMFKTRLEANVGYKSVAVPGTPAGLGLAHDKFGRLKWADCLEPARKLAKDGFPASMRLELILRLQVPVMKQFAESSRIFLHGADQPLKQGELVKQPELADTIRRLQRKGWREFYEGETARRIAADMSARGGLITEEDLRQYRALLVVPLRSEFRGHAVLTMPPSSSGGLALAVALNVLDRYPMPPGMEGSAASRHLLIEAMRRGFAARDRVFKEGESIMGAILSPEYTRQITANLQAGRATGEVPAPAATNESPDTTHFTVVDSEGSMVTNTYTLSGFFGSQVTATGTGVLLNNHMSVFSSRPGTYNSIEPGRRYRSTMAPTIVLRRDGAGWLALGTPGAGTIPSTLAQVIVNMIDFRMSLRDAVEFPRIHAQTGPVEAEPAALVFEVAEKLKQMGHNLAPRHRSQGDVSMIEIEEGTGWRVGWADGRRGGFVKGY